MKIELMIMFFVEFLIVTAIALAMSIISGVFEYCRFLPSIGDVILNLFIFMIPYLIALQYIIGWTFAIMGDD